MKMRIKNKSKKGFTLLEVMLAVAILTIASTMIMEGFLATMGYSTNTSIYSRAGAKNYSVTIGKLAEYSTDSDDFYKRYVNYVPMNDSTADYSSVQTSVSIPGAGGFNKTDIDVQVWKATKGSEDYAAYNVTGKYDEDPTVSDNRMSFFYTPSSEHLYCEICKNWGYIGFFKHGADTKADWYCVYPYEPTKEVKVIPKDDNNPVSGKPCCEGRDS